MDWLGMWSYLWGCYFTGKIMPKQKQLKIDTSEQRGMGVNRLTSFSLFIKDGPSPANF